MTTKKTGQLTLLISELQETKKTYDALDDFWVLRCCMRTQAKNLIRNLSVYRKLQKAGGE